MLQRVKWLGTVLLIGLGAGGPAQAVADFAAAREEAKRLQLAPGFQLDVWAAEPLLANGVAFSFDNHGRCFVAESHRWARSIFDITQKTNWLLADMSFRTTADRAAFLLREFATNSAVLTQDSELVRLVEDRDADGRADQSSVFAEGFNSVLDGTAAGVLARGSDVWFANIPNLWRLGAGGRREVLGTGFGVHIGVSGHDLHGLIRGPDGRLYASFGDRGVSLTNREGAVIHLPDCGGVVRCEPDGRNLELFCQGLRNPQELAFDDFGNLWTVDNDTAGADPCRLLHLVEGADYGWRTSYQHMEGFGPWVQEALWRGGQDGILPLAGTVSQGPSGLAYYPGTGFGDRLAGRFLHCDFPGGVVEFNVRPQGASYVIDHKDRFLWNCWPTDVDFGPDGSVYVLDWVAGWGRPQKGRIYRVAPTDDAAAVGVQRYLREGMTQRPEAELLSLLAHADRRVRLEAQWELAARGTPSLPGLVRAAREGTGTLRRIHALWGVGQIFESAGLENRDSWTETLHELAQLVADSDPEVRGQTAYILGSLGLANLRTDLKSLLSDPESRVRFLAAMGATAGRRKAGFWSPDLVARLAAKLAALAIRGKAPPEIWEPLANATHGAPKFPIDAFLAAAAGPFAEDAFLMHSIVSLLASSQAAGASPESASWMAQAAAHESPQVRLAAILAWRRTQAPQLTNFLTDPEPRLIEAAGRAIHDAPIAAGFPALASFITKVDCPPGLHSRVIDACYRLGTPQYAQMLAGFAARRDVPDASRALALSALADWERPAPLDRVNGLWRPLISRSANREVAETAAGVAPSSNPLLNRAAQAQAARNVGRPAALPLLPPDLGRSTSFEEAMALRRNPAPAQRALLRVAGELLYPNTPSEAGVVIPGTDSAQVQLALIAAAVKLRTKDVSTPFFEKLASSNSLPEVRRAIVPALAALNAATVSEAVRLALTDPDLALRASAVPHLDRLEGDAGLRLLLALAGNDQADLASRQAAWRSLGPHLVETATQPTDLAASVVALVQSALDQVLAGTLPAGLQLDVLETAAQSHDAGHRQRLATWNQRTDPKDPLALYRPALIGGNSAAGRRIFFEKPETQCARCHQVAGQGGTVGPALDGLGKRARREEILESILLPNVRLAPGFESVVLTLEAGTTVAGTLKREANGQLVLVAGEDGEVRVEASKVKARARGPSAMPEGLGTWLSRLEMRDLIEYLASLR